MKPYFATFISGCEPVIAARLSHMPAGDLKVGQLSDGLVLFDSSLSPNQLSELRFFNNVYELLPAGEVPPMPPNAAVVLRARKGSRPVPFPPDLQKKVESAGAYIVAHKPNVSFLWWQRQDGQILWGRMLPRVGFKTRRLEPGELRPELAHILGLVASLDAKHSVLDPFAGYGSIARECLQGFHAKQAIALEQNEHLLPHLKSIPHLVAMQGDARKMEALPSRSIDRVITDPPWGEFSNATDDELRQLYTQALQEIHRVLRAKGCAVILTSASWLPQIAQAQHFTIEKTYNILVSGKKATIYKLRKSE